MHELSIVQNIVEIAQEQVLKARAEKVDQIDLEIGDLAGIEMDAFLFAWDSAVPDTVLSTAKRKIHKVEAKAKCNECGCEFRMVQLYDPCPDCGACFSDLLSGKELKLRSLVVS